MTRAVRAAHVEQALGRVVRVAGDRSGSALHDQRYTHLGGRRVGMGRIYRAGRAGHERPAKLVPSEYTYWLPINVVVTHTPGAAMSTGAP